MTTLTMKIIEIVADLWKHRNEALHKRDSIVRQRDHDKLNKAIDECMRKLPQSLRVFTAAEQRFFRRTKITQLKQCKLRQKQQWIDAAQSIINSFRENLHTNPQARVMRRAMNLIQTEQTQNKQHEYNNQNSTNMENEQANGDRNDNIENAVNRNDNNAAQDNTDSNDDKDNTSKDSNDKPRINELHDLQIKEDKNDKNEPNG